MMIFCYSSIHQSSVAIYVSNYKEVCHFMTLQMFLNSHVLSYSVLNETLSDFVLLKSDSLDDESLFLWLSCGATLSAEHMSSKVLLVSHRIKSKCQLANRFSWQSDWIVILRLDAFEVDVGGNVASRSISCLLPTKICDYSVVVWGDYAGIGTHCGTDNANPDLFVDNSEAVVAVVGYILLSLCVRESY